MNKTNKWRTSEGEAEGFRWPCGVCSKGVGSNSLQLPEMGTQEIS